MTGAPRSAESQLGFTFDVSETTELLDISETAGPSKSFDQGDEHEPLEQQSPSEPVVDLPGLNGLLQLGLNSDPSAHHSGAPVQVTRSKRSRKTVSARYRDGVLHITIPAWMSRADEQKWVATMEQRFAKANRKTDTDLMDRARQLGRAYGLPKPASVVWTRELKSRWGSCTIDTATIRINGKLTTAPSWVVDYVLVHELAHLVHADHSAAFWDVVNRYPKTERAIGFLMGMGLAED